MTPQLVAELLVSNAKRQVGKAQELIAESNSLSDVSRETLKTATAIVKKTSNLRRWVKKLREERAFRNASRILERS